MTKNPSFGRLRLMTPLLLLCCSANLLAENTDNMALVVHHSTDAGAILFENLPALPVEATEVVANSGANIGFESLITPSPSGPDLTNHSGREDARPRVLHTGTEFMLKAIPSPSLTSPPTLKPDWMAAHYIDVGQGNAALLEFSCGLALIDTGGQEAGAVHGTDRILSYLNRVFDRRPDLHRTLSLVVLTHPHIDHTRGVIGLLAASPNPIIIGSVVTNARTQGSGFAQQKELQDFASAHHIPLILVKNEDIVRSDGLTNSGIDPLSCHGTDPDIRVLWGADSGPHSWVNNENNHSVVVRVDFGQSSFLFTGDMEDVAQAEFISSYARNPEILDVDVYAVGHHGSKNGTTAALVAAMTPEIAVISSGNPANMEPGFSAFDFAHPNKVAIDLLSDPRFGVSLTRPIKRAAVGLHGKAPNSSTAPTFEVEDISRAIFDTGWDGDVVVAASLTGQKVVQIK